MNFIQRVHCKVHATSFGLYRRADLGRGRHFEGLAGHDSQVQDGRARIMGAKPNPEERIVRSGKIVTAAGVPAGIDLALCLAGEIVGREGGEAIQLAIEYDPHPPFDAGHMSQGVRMRPFYQVQHETYSTYIHRTLGA